MQIELSPDNEKLLKKYREVFSDGIYNTMGTSDTRVANRLLEERLKIAIREAEVARDKVASMMSAIKARKI